MPKPLLHSLPTSDVVDIRQYSGDCAARTAATRQSPSLVSQSRPYRASVSYRNGRAYVENVRLISTRAHKPPIPRGHRMFVGKQEWR